MSKAKSLSDAHRRHRGRATSQLVAGFSTRTYGGWCAVLLRTQHAIFCVLVPAPGSIAPLDMLIGAGCVRRTGCVFIAFDRSAWAATLPSRAENRYQDSQLYCTGDCRGLRAAACDLPSA